MRAGRWLIWKFGDVGVARRVPGSASWRSRGRRACAVSLRHGLIWGYHSRNLSRALGIESHRVRAGRGPEPRL